jgi:hypothetical protein
MPTRMTETARVPEDISGRQRRIPVGGITWRHTFRALRHRNYRLFFWSQLISLIGTWMQQTAMSWFVYETTNSKLLLGLVSAAGSAPMVLSSIWGGTLADLYPKRSILVATQSAQMVCAFYSQQVCGSVLRHPGSSSLSPRSTDLQWVSTCPRASPLQWK